MTSGGGGTALAVLQQQPRFFGFYALAGVVAGVRPSLCIAFGRWAGFASVVFGGVWWCVTKARCACVQISACVYYYFGELLSAISASALACGV